MIKEHVRKRDGLLTLPQCALTHSETVLFRTNIGHGQVATSIKQFIRSNVITRQEFNPRLAIERFGSGRE
jgi:hypothetical protein